METIKITTKDFIDIVSDADVNNVLDRITDEYLDSIKPKIKSILLKKMLAEAGNLVIDKDSIWLDCHIKH